MSDPEIFHRDIDGVRRALEFGRTAVGDGLSDTYKDLWEVATEPEPVFRQRRVPENEDGLSFDGRRRAKVLRRVGILSYADASVEWRLKTDKDEPALTDVFQDTLTQIADAYGITSEDIAQHVAAIHKNPYALPHYLRSRS